MRVPAAVSDSTVFSSGYLEMIWRIARRASPRYSWARGRRASRRSVGQSWCEQGRAPGPPGKPAFPCLRAPDPRGETEAEVETAAAQSPLRASLGCWPGPRGPDRGLGSPCAQDTFHVLPESKLLLDLQVAAPVPTSSMQPPRPLSCHSLSGPLKVLSGPPAVIYSSLILQMGKLRHRKGKSFLKNDEAFPRTPASKA